MVGDKVPKVGNMTRKTEPMLLHKQDDVVVRSRRLACQNSKFNVYFEHVRDARGYEVPDYLVVAPRHHGAGLVTGVAILPFVGEKVGVVRIWRPATEGYSWEIPHGFIEATEESPVSAVRELKEETGLVAGSIQSLGHVAPDAGVLAARIHLYLARSCKVSDSRAGELGLDEFRLVEQGEFEKMVRSAEIQDAITLAAWCRWRLMEDDKGSFAVPQSVGCGRS